MATPTAVDVVMPQMGVSVSEGTITKWLKQEGEEIQADEPLLEISTDKVDTEVPSPATGVVQQILVQEGETVEVGTRLAVVGGPGEAAAEAPAEPEPAPEQAPTDVSGDGKSFVSPVVARIASEHDVDVSRVQGTGRGGRVTKKDILAYVASRAEAPEAREAAPAPAEAPAPPEPAEAPAAPPPPPPAPEPAPTPAPTPTPAAAAPAPPPAAAEAAPGEEE